MNRTEWPSRRRAGPMGSFHSSCHSITHREALQRKVWKLIRSACRSVQTRPACAPATLGRVTEQLLASGVLLWLIGPTAAIIFSTPPGQERESHGCPENNLDSKVFDGCVLDADLAGIAG